MGEPLQETDAQVGGLTNSIFHSVFWQAKTQIANKKKPKQIIFNQRSRAKYLPDSPGFK